MLTTKETRTMLSNLGVDCLWEPYLRQEANPCIASSLQLRRLQPEQSLLHQFQVLIIRLFCPDFN